MSWPERNVKITVPLTKRQRQKLRARHEVFQDMHPAIFDKAFKLIPSFLTGFEIPAHKETKGFK